MNILPEKYLLLLFVHCNHMLLFQQFDWKRHKPICKQMQAETQRRQTAAGPSSCSTYTQTETSCSTSTSSPDPSPPWSETPPLSFLAGLGNRCRSHFGSSYFLARLHFLRAHNLLSEGILWLGAYAFLLEALSSSCFRIIPGVFGSK